MVIFVAGLILLLRKRGKVPTVGAVKTAAPSCKNGVIYL